MGAVKTNWHLADLDLVEDPDAASAIARLQSDAERIDLTRPADMLAGEIVASMRREQNYSQMFGLDCDLKWTVDPGPESTFLRNPCRSCPHFVADPAVDRSLVCMLGREQEDLIDSYFATVASAAMDDEMLAAFEADLDASQELAEALL